MLAHVDRDLLVPLLLVSTEVNEDRSLGRESEAQPAQHVSTDVIGTALLSNRA